MRYFPFFHISREFAWAPSHIDSQRKESNLVISLTTTITNNRNLSQLLALTTTIVEPRTVGAINRCEFIVLTPRVHSKIVETSRKDVDRVEFNGIFCGWWVICEKLTIYFDDVIGVKDLDLRSFLTQGHSLHISWNWWRRRLQQPCKVRPEGGNLLVIYKFWPFWWNFAIKMAKIAWQKSDPV